MTGMAATAAAADGCGMRAVKLLLSGETTQLQRLFGPGDPPTVRQLNDLGGLAGRVSDLTEAGRPRFDALRRYSVSSAGLSNLYAFQAFRVNGTSAIRGPVQFIVAVVPGSDCMILEMALEVGVDARVSSGAPPGRSVDRRPTILLYPLAPKPVARSSPADAPTGAA
jgi:hypothetical protein